MIQTVKWDGRQISKFPCIVTDLPLGDYHRPDICNVLSISSSLPRTLTSTSPLHAYAKAAPFNPNRIPEKSKKHFREGELQHALAVGGVFFSDRFAIQPVKRGTDAWHGAKKWCKAWKAEQLRAGKVIITEDEIANARGMAVALGNNPLVQQGILNGRIEHSLFSAPDKETGFVLKARPDVLPNDSGDFVDLKTTTSVRYRDLQRDIYDFGYFQQAAMVIDVARSIGIEVSSFSFVFVEKTPPWAVRVVTLKDEDIARGSKLNRIALRTIADCIASGFWPGPGEDRDRADAEYIDLPDWARKSIDDRIKYQLKEAA